METIMVNNGSPSFEQCYDGNLQERKRVRQAMLDMQVCWSMQFRGLTLRLVLIVQHKPRLHFDSTNSLSLSLFESLQLINQSINRSFVAAAGQRREIEVISLESMDENCRYL
jgi:hypothetical protein